MFPVTVPIVILSFAAAVNSLAAASRETWAFSRDGGLIMSRWWAKVTVKGGTPVPVNATILANWFTVLSALLNLAGPEAYDTIISLATGAVCGSYVVSIGSMILGRLSGRRLPKSRFRLGPASKHHRIPLQRAADCLLVFPFVQPTHKVSRSPRKYESWY